MNKIFIDRSKQVMRSLAFTRGDFEFARQPNGEVSYVVALPNESYKDVLKRVEALEKPFNILLADAVGFEILPVKGSAEGNSFRVMKVSPDISMGMLAIKLRRNAGTIFRLDVEERDDLMTEVAILPQIAYA